MDLHDAIAAIAAVETAIVAARDRVAELMREIQALTAVAELRAGVPMPSAMKTYEPDNLATCLAALGALRRILEDGAR
jgi:hypothetical protein